LWRGRARPGRALPRWPGPQMKSPGSLDPRPALLRSGGAYLASWSTRSRPGGSSAAPRSWRGCATCWRVPPPASRWWRWWAGRRGRGRPRWGGSRPPPRGGGAGGGGLGAAGRRGGGGRRFGTVTEALRGLAGELDGAELKAVAGPARADLGRLLPGVGWGAAAAPAAAVAGASQGRLFELLLGVIERLAARAPLLLVMEDLHWADRSTRDLVAFLAAALRSGRGLLVGAFRSGAVPRAPPPRGLLGGRARRRPRRRR